MVYKPIILETLARILFTQQERRLTYLVEVTEAINWDSRIPLWLLPLTIQICLYGKTATEYILLNVVLRGSSISQ